MKTSMSSFFKILFISIIVSCSDNGAVSKFIGKHLVLIVGNSFSGLCCCKKEINMSRCISKDLRETFLGVLREFVCFASTLRIRKEVSTSTHRPTRIRPASYRKFLHMTTQTSYCHIPDFPFRELTAHSVTK